MAGNFDLLLRVLLVALPDLPPKAQAHARGLLALIDLQKIVTRDERPPTAAKLRFKDRAHRWAPTVVGTPNPVFVAKGAPVAHLWTDLILTALAPGPAHAQEIRERINTTSSRRAVTWVYSWVLHYMWDIGLVTATWRYRLTTWELTDLGRARLAEIDGGDDPK